MNTWVAILIVTRVALLIMGTVTTGISYRAYRRERSRYLRESTIAFGLITIGVIIEGVLFQLTGLTLAQVHVAESVLIGAGFLVLLYSLIR